MVKFRCWFSCARYERGESVMATSLAEARKKAEALARRYGMKVVEVKEVRL